MELEWCNFGILMAIQFGGEEFMRGACDVDDGQDKRDDSTQAHDDHCEVMDRGDGGVEEKSQPKAVEKARRNKPDGTVNAPDA